MNILCLSLVLRLKFGSSIYIMSCNQCFYDLSTLVSCPSDFIESLIINVLRDTGRPDPLVLLSPDNNFSILEPSFRNIPIRTFFHFLQVHRLTRLEIPPPVFTGTSNSNLGILVHRLSPTSLVIPLFQVVQSFTMFTVR